MFHIYNLSPKLNRKRRGQRLRLLGEYADPAVLCWVLNITSVPITSLAILGIFCLKRQMKGY